MEEKEIQQQEDQSQDKLTEKEQEVGQDQKIDIEQPEKQEEIEISEQVKDQQRLDENKQQTNDGQIKSEPKQMQIQYQDDDKSLEKIKFQKSENKDKGYPIPFPMPDRNHPAHPDHPDYLQHKATEWEASINLFKSFVGISVLVLPIAFSRSGWLASLVITVILGYLMYYTTNLMLQMATKRNISPQNISEFAVYFMGEGSRIYITFLLISLQCSVGISYVSFIITYLELSFCEYFGESFCGVRVYAVISTLIIIVPLSLVRNLKYLKDVNLFAIIIMIGALIICVFYEIKLMNEQGVQGEKLFDFWNLPHSIGVIVLAYEGIGTVFDIRFSMKEPEAFQRVLLNQTHLMVILYSTFGILGYLAFGDDVEHLVLFNLPLSNWIFGLTIFAYCVNLSISYPLQLFPVVNYIENRIKLGWIQDNQKEAEDKRLALLQEKQNLPAEIDSKQQQGEENEGTKDKDEGEGCPLVNFSKQQIQNQPKIHHPTGFRYQLIDEEEGDGLSEADMINELTDEQKKKFEYAIYTVRATVIVMVFAVAMILTNVSAFLNLAGCASGIGLLYVFPIIAYNMKEEDVSNNKIILNWIISGIGVFAGSIGVYLSSEELMHFF